MGSDSRKRRPHRQGIFNGGFVLTLAISMFVLMAPCYAASRNIPFVEGYYNIFFMGKKAGYIHETVQPLDRTRFLYKSKESWEAKRGGAEMKIERSESYTVGMDLKPIDFSIYQNMNGQITRTTGKLNAGVMIVKQNVGGSEKTLKIKLAAGTIVPGLARFMVMRSNPKPGSVFSSKFFLADFNRVVDAKVKILEERKEKLPNGSCTAIVMQTTFLNMVTKDVFCKNSGLGVRSEIANLNIKIEITTKKEAKAKFDKSDIFSEIVIKSPRNLMPTRKLKKLRVEIKGDPLPGVVEDSRQTIMRKLSSKNTLVIDLEAQAVPEGKIFFPIKDKMLSPYLAPEAYIQSDAKGIRAAARKAVDGEKRLWPAVKRLVRFTYEYISSKNYDEGYLSALEVLKKRSGDCTEHSIFFVALARSIGIPARLLLGITHINGFFGYHQWPEVYVGKQGWVQVDPTLGQYTVDASHLALAHMSGSKKDWIEAIANVMKFIGSDKLDILSAEWKNGTRWIKAKGRKNN
ncbi:MAG: transglutaminase domain-containing protein [Deltaproteobacteria bacterium]|nr:transglutaminase domain-containing protein [Deltaproteobacteria bacterium]